MEKQVLTDPMLKPENHVLEELLQRRKVMAL